MNINNINDYQQLASRTICPQMEVAERLNKESNLEKTLMLYHSVVGMTGEVGELATAVEKTCWYGSELDRLNVIEELGDVLWYVAEACTALDVDLEWVMSINIRKLEERYPEKYQQESALNRNLDKERKVLESGADSKKKS
jgi:NTP pyrophosphatase (non-canonical NTP hydrolase)